MSGEKLTIVHTERNNRLVTSVKSLDKFMERITKDDAKGTITQFRNYVPYMTLGYDGYKDMPKWMHVMPAAEFQKAENGTLVMKHNNGILLFTLAEIQGEAGLEGAKQKVAALPSTLAAFLSADGKMLHVLVKYTLADGKLPDDEQAAKSSYLSAFYNFAPIYLALVDGKMNEPSPSLHSDFLFTLDEHPYYNATAAPLRLSPLSQQAPAEAVDVPSIAEKEAESDTAKADKDLQDRMMRMIQFLQDKYELRYNSVMKFTEYRTKEKNWWGFLPIDSRVQKRMTIEVQKAGIRVSIKDVRNYLESDFIRNYNPIDDYLFSCRGKWDGKDHIRALARTVPTQNKHWEDWFYIWFLGMVDQWKGFSHRLYGNSVAPLLISKQGYNKSTFCRRLVPPEFQSLYSDNLILSEKRQVFQAMTQCMLINLDEFNQISPQVQQGFLKNLIQLPTVKLKPPYGSHVMEFPRLASFIATSNMDDILSDPSGNRRFIGIELTGPIDVSYRPNYVQLYAQAQAALDKGEKGYFDAQQTQLLMESNKQFEVITPVEQYFRMCFEPTEDESQGEYLTAAEIFDQLKQRIGSSLKVNTLAPFGRKLAQMPGLKHKRTRIGTKYLVRVIAR